ncbi:MULTISPECIES: LysE family translocator [Symbiopectobacterium]|uniref:LysE family translocator n=1 Tax=Symbiopectobacterium TaxID=801 RepID=UPI001A23D2B9|nr:MULTISPECIES: LysE family translocator [Symbiopectobacterium]MBG6249140.1 LysE family translocator [Candidatus Symbiopectobacterium sp. PLON1]MBT9430531.1 LysE family translocator [Candidatus Symbiopectobacterium endolongispinus]
MPQLYLYILLSSLTIASPGPGVLLTITNMLNFNLKNAVADILGIAAGMGAISVVAASSVGVLIVSSSYSLIVVKVAGASYLAYLGVKLYKSAPKLVDKNRMVNINEMPSTIARFRQGFLLSLLNPKPIVFFMALFPQFITNNNSYVFQFLVLSLTFCLLVIVIHCIYGVFASAIKREISSHHLLSVLNKVGVVIFMLFSAGLFISSLLPFWQ